MRNDGQRNGDGGAHVPRQARANNGIIPASIKTISGYLKIVSSGASNVASSVRSAASAASAIVERDAETNRDQVSWAGFDSLELEGGITRQVLLLGFSYGFEVWDVEAADNVCNLVSRHDGPVSFMQMLPKPVVSNQSRNQFAESCSLLIICADGSFNGDTNVWEGLRIPTNGSSQQPHGTINGSCMPTVVWFYSMKSHTYVHLLRFRSAVHLVRCSSRVVAVLQSTQIHCLNPATLEREYTILTNTVPAGIFGSGDTALGPLAVGPRWIAYSGTQVAVSNSGRVVPQHLNTSPSFPCASSNGSLVAHYAKESGKQLAAGIVSLGEMGYKKLSRYYSERIPEGRNGSARVKGHGIANGHSTDDSAGMVIVRDIVSKNVIAQFRAHKSPISSLCFDPSGILLVTASVQGNNINVFRIMPGVSEVSGSSYAHLYQLQRGLTNAVIRDISFSSDSQWVMISSSRGTTHLFPISPSGGMVRFQFGGAFYNARYNGSSLIPFAVNGSSNSGIQVLTPRCICASGPPITLSPVRRIRNGSNGWINIVGGAAAAATGLLSPISCAIASTFHNCKGNDLYVDSSSLKRNYNLLVFSPSGSVIQYALHITPRLNGLTQTPGLSDNSESNLDCDVIVEASQKWNICQKHNCKERRENIDMYGEDGSTDNSKVYPERTKQENLSSDSLGTTVREEVSTEEKHHMYISEAELQMHQNENPLWARPQICFQSMLTDGFSIDEECVREGEIEIERVPTRMLEARSKDLVPVFDYLQTPKLQQGRGVGTTNILPGACAIDAHGSDEFHPRKFEDGKVACGASSTSLDSTPYGGIMEDERDIDLGEKRQDGLHFAGTSRGNANVNTNIPQTVRARFETVNTRHNSVGETQDNSVHNRDGLNTENQFTKSDDGFND